MKQLAILSILILITACSSHPESVSYPILEPYECNTTIHTNSTGGLNRREAAKLMKCYKDMKAFYLHRDSAFNSIYGGRDG